MRGVFERVRNANLGMLKLPQHLEVHDLKVIGEVLLNETAHRSMMLMSSTRSEIASLTENGVDDGRRTEHNNGLFLSTFPRNV